MQNINNRPLKHDFRLQKIYFLAGCEQMNEKTRRTHAHEATNELTI